MMFFASLLLAAGAALAQQYEGDVVSGFLPTIPGTEVAFFKIADPTGKNNNLTLANYYAHGTDGPRIVESKIQRAVIVIHGLLRDPWNYENDVLNALKIAHAADANISVDSVAVIAPYFPSGADKGFAYPWVAENEKNNRSTSNLLVWSGSQWSAGANNQYPYNSKTTSSFYVLDRLVSYFDQPTRFPNLKQIVLVGHSMGGQMVQRYAAVSTLLTRSPLTHWIGNPDSYAWLDETRPLSTNDCPDFDDYRSGYANYTDYGDGGMTYGTGLVDYGRQAIIDNYKSKQIAYGRALLDHGDHSSDCGANTTGADRHERLFYYIDQFPPSCPDPSKSPCDTLDLINVSHDNGQMFNSAAGQARIFTDNFYGDGKRAYDFGYPRAQSGDDPYPDPSQVSTPGNTITGNWTYQGCWTNQEPITPAALPRLLYDNTGNSIEGCTSGCQGAGYAIAGVQNGTQCFCGNALNSESAVAIVDSTCRIACPGNAYEICGGYNRLSVFSASYPAFE